ncbi:hypothetical protein FQN49_000350, partial [Arthroderma sp. PD_2]
PPTSVGSGGSAGAGTVGITVNRSGTANAAVEQKTAASLNPFDAMSAQPSSTTTSLDQSFQNLQVSSQPLFPNMTGGYPSQQGNIQLPRPQQSMTPPVPTMQHQHQLQQQQYGAISQPPLNGNYSHNPFMSQSTPVTPNSTSGIPNQPLSPTNPFFTQMQQQPTGAQQVQNPQYYLQHHNTMPTLPSSYMYQQPQQQQQQQQQQTYQQPAMPTYQTQPMQQQPQQPQQPNRIDKSSILALYNFSQPPPTIPEQPQQQTQEQQPQLPHLQTNNAFSTNPYLTNTSTSTSPMVVSAPATMGGYANHNPFFTSNTAPQSAVMPAPPTQAPAPAPASNTMGYSRTHMSQESLDIRQAQTGRHSPDIFASLSARY